MAAKAKLSLKLEKLVVERVAKKETLDSIRAWLKAKHRISITKQALSKTVAKHRAPPPSVEQLEPPKKTGRRVSSFDAHRARLSRLLKLVTKDAILERSLANVDKVAKATTAWMRLEEAHRAANKPVDESVASIADLLAKA